MRFHHSSCKALIATAGIVTATAVAQGQQYSASALGLPDGATSYSASRMSNDGHWIAGSATFADGSTRPVVWHDSVPTLIPTLGGTYGYAADVNNSGLVVGASANRAFAFSGGTTTALSANTSYGSFASAVNDAGVIVGQSGGWSPFGDQRRAVSWSSPTSPVFDVHGHAGLPSGVAFTGSSYAADISSSGVVGGFLDPNLVLISFTYNPVSGASGWGAPVSTDSCIRAFNAEDGTGIRYAVGDASGLGNRFVYRWSATETANGRFDGSGLGRVLSMVPLAVNANGAFVGYQPFPGGSSDARIGTFDGPEVSLDSLLLPGTTIDLTAATEVANSGVIIANGVDAAGFSRAYVLTPVPSPGAATLLLGAAVLGHRRRR